MKKRIISIDITSGSYESFVTDLLHLAHARTSSYVCIAHVRLLIKAYQDKGVAGIVNNAAVVVPNGMPLAFAFKKLHGVSQERIAGVDLLPGLLQAAEAANMPVFFLGINQEVLDQTWEYCDWKYPNLDVAGVHCYSKKPYTDEEDWELVRRINESRAAFVFVALDVPEQEQWMADRKGKIQACMVGVGDCLPIIVKTKKRAPLWMQNTGMEWVFCLLQEPFRLTSRYLITNSMYLWLFSKIWISKTFLAFELKGGRRG